MTAGPLVSFTAPSERSGLGKQPPTACLETEHDVIASRTIFDLGRDMETSKCLLVG